MSTFARLALASSTLWVTAAQLACQMAPPSALDPEPVELSVEWIGIPWVQTPDGDWVLADTGAPRTVMTSHGVGLDPGPAREVTLEDWGPLLPVPDIDVLVFDEPVGVASIRPEPYGGVLGFDVLRHHPLSIDPRAGTMWVGRRDPSSRPSHTQAPIDVPTDRLGAGNFCVTPEQCVPYPESRLVFPVVVDGEQTWALLDTGASESVATEGLLARRPGRDEQSTLTSRDENGDAGLSLHRATVTIAGTSVPDIIVRSGFDETLFAKLQVETGRRVEMLVGWSHLESFVVDVDVATPALVLYPYTEPTPPRRLFGNGMVLRDGDDDDSGCWVVTRVYQGLPADLAGIDAGDCVVSYDGDGPTERTAASVNTDPTSPIEVMVAQGDRVIRVQLNVVEMLAGGAR